MSQAFLPIVIIVAVLGISISLTRLAWPFKVMQSLGKTGSWIHHEDMEAPEGRPDGNQNDPAIAHRPLRGRSAEPTR
jgi:hypothetical protein